MHKACVDCGNRFEGSPEIELCEECVGSGSESNSDLWELLKEKELENRRLNRLVEKMQKTLEWYADESNYEMIETSIDAFSTETTSATWQDSGQRARQTLQSLKEDKP